MPFDLHDAAQGHDAALDRALSAIPPAWPLAATVAVNPFLGQVGEDFATAAARLARVGGIATTMPREWFAARIASGAIAEEDLAAALEAAPAAHRPESLAALRAALARPRPAPRALPTVAELVAEITGTDWPGIIADRLGGFAASWFDAGQALWPVQHRGALYASWRATALRDLTPEILGLPGFCAHVAATPAGAAAATGRALAALGVPMAARETLLHRLLMTLGGWAQLARQRGFEAELEGRTDPTLGELLAARLVWEEALFAAHAEALAPRWAEVLDAHAAPVAAGPEEALDAILQDAADRAGQRALAAKLAGAAAAPVETRPVLQAAFCIDVRSEVMRRALESLDPGIRTQGFAGFFGLPVAHQAFASDVVENRLPVLLRPSLRSCTAVEGEVPARIGARAKRAWGRFSQAAVSSFAFVEAAGLLHAGGLLRDALGLKRAAKAEPPPRLPEALTPEARIATAEAVLRAMSMTEGFAPLVLLLGHGATVANNPHASALHCGACGGHRGDVSARLLALLLNDKAVRAGLDARGIAVPEDTLFLAGLHDTTGDRVTLYAADHPPHPATAQAEAWLARAGALARAERALRLPRAAGGEAIPARATDWAETRPEWGLAGCQAFIAAPRALTAGRDLGGRVFLHDYDWRRDAGFGVLELILTAPVVVASWISLQYHGSVVAPEAFGGGNKLLHNVTGGVGVVEGNGGTLRVGLPWQSVHDGESLAHEPLRLSVHIAAPREEIGVILDRHPGVRALFTNGWLHLLALDEAGRSWRLGADGSWS
ncbi:YbcC family protein [Roseococcus suduntuyensis]|uniref:Probable inorganic carbon transporter subunit DabA n=1 Tax=Roseococcus suduntuyensis TaxID=455361 RepID=A0A840AFX6_9PROT|nr:DUF2309 domain-containing protein [Roseococcus suduntuyensis]MBB3899947.1 hypothetical protein [Roseococcus suduntuyensis]